jgi:hypothetical protein
LVEVYTFGAFFAFGLVVWGALMMEWGAMLTGLFALVLLLVGHFHRKNQSNYDGFCIPNRGI